MSPQLLEEIGLNSSQAKVYLALIEKGALTPPAVSEVTNENRTNAYMVLEQLEKLGLAEKLQKAKKLTYQATNPINLEKVSEKRRKAVMDAESRVKQAMPILLSYYYSFTERPGIKLVEGLDGLKEIYQETLRTKEPIYLVRTPHEVKSLGIEYINKYVAKRRELRIPVKAITPDVADAIHNPNVDKSNLLTRKWVKATDYTAPVEINVFGNKVAFASFGEETMGVIIDSPAIAEAMRQLLNLIHDGAIVDQHEERLGVHEPSVTRL